MNEFRRTNINEYRQNKPTLLARDFEAVGIPRAITYTVLLSRGVFKWLAVRRQLIHLKDVWKVRITSTLNDIQLAKREGDHLHHAYLKGYLKAHEECRKEVRALCHSGRWQVQDNDQDAQRFLARLDGYDGR